MRFVPKTTECSAKLAMNRSGGGDAAEEDIPLERRHRSEGRNGSTEGDGNKERFAQKIDLHSYTGLTTILVVNLQQLYLMFSVGPDLGAMFYILTVLASISAILVVGSKPQYLAYRVRDVSLKAYLTLR